MFQTEKSFGIFVFTYGRGGGGGGGERDLPL